MEMDRSYVTERILHLTLEIIYLLTGEDYGPVKRGEEQHVTPSSHPLALVRWRKKTICVRKPSVNDNNKKILEVIQKMIELLTGEVPIRCQDVSVYFSMEEWEYLEGHKDLYKDIVMMEDQPPLKSQDGSSNRNPLERCPHPLDSQDSIQEQEKFTEDSKDNSIAYHYQGEDSMLIKVEDFEAEGSYVRDEELSEINTDGRYKSYDREKCPIVSENEAEEHSITANSPDPQPHLHSTHTLSGTSANGGDFPNSSQSTSHPTGMLSFSESGNCFLETPQKAQTQEKPFSCSQCGKTFGKKANMARHQRTHMDGKTYSCSECGKVFLRKSSFVEHQRMHKGEKTYSCSECGKCFQWRSTLFYHQRRHKEGRVNKNNRGRRRGGSIVSDSQKVVPILPKPNPILPCLYVSSVPVSHFSSFTHYMGNEPRPSPECSEVLSVETNQVPPHRTYKIENECTISPYGDEPLFGSNCHELPGGRENRVQPQRTHKVKDRCLISTHEDEPLLVPKHSNMLEGENPPQQRMYKLQDRCPMPPYGDDGTLKPNLVSLDKPITAKKEFSCVQCGKSFFDESNFLKHQRNHSQSKSYLCPLCGKAFSKKSNLLRHQRMHSTEKLFSCSECGKCFLRKSVLVEHQRMHTGEKKYCCSECGKCFQWRSSHFYHIRKHRGVMPVTCVECGKCFAQKSHLAQHQKMHAAEKQYLFYSSVGTER